MSQTYIDSLLSRAYKNYEKQKFSEAEKLFEEALKIEPDHIGCLNYFATLLAQTNRKNRAEKLFLKAVKLQPSNPFVNNNLGNIYYGYGDFNKAISYYRAAISLKSDFIDPNLNLGIIFNNMGDLNKALNHLKKVIQIQPNNIKCYAIIATIYKKQRNFKNTFNCYKKIFDIDSDNLMATTGIVDLFDTLRLKNIDENNSHELTEIFTFLFKKNSINHNKLFENAKKLIIFENQKKIIENLHKTKSLFLNDHSVLLLIKKELFHLMLQKSLFRDKFFEKFLYYIRNEFLNLLKNKQEDFIKDHINFILSLAIQSSLNEYIFFQSDDEINFIDKLKTKIEKNENIKEFEVAILACYIPLNQSKNLVEKLSNVSSSNNLFNEIIKTQIKDILEEERLKKTINSSQITNQVSQKVRNQYEENPYPRWKYINKIYQTDCFSDLNNDISPNRISLNKETIEKTILIAGCGTGQQLARKTFYKDATVLAVDLSLSSLALAKRKMQELNSKNIEFLHSDILNLKKIKRKFHIVECMGVLHHLDDPEAGLSILLDLLKPQGYLKLGLYSELARKHIVETRESLKKHNFKNTLTGIRNCREMIKSNNDNKSFAKLNYNYDFYTTSSFRDLVLHVQEQRFTIPKISKLIQKYNLQFLGFTDPYLKKDYLKYFKDDINTLSLQNWNKFEIEHPDIFRGMYQFWVKKN